jgi:ABC-type bacteriocin/lantibiotic exporter with double-glycine peptidase domain
MIIKSKLKGWAGFWGNKNLLFLLLFILGACSTTNSFLKPEKQENLPYRLIENVPFFAQSNLQCGPSSLAGILSFYGKDISPSEIAEEIFKEKVRGTLSLDIVLYARNQGLVAEWYTGNVQDLIENIDNKIPLIVMIDLGLGAVQKPHYLVVVGYEQKGVIVNSGAHQHQIVPWNKFQNQWNRSSLWTLRIQPEPIS